MVPKGLQVDSTRRIYRMRDTPYTTEEWAAKHGATVEKKPDEPTH
jgi:hypothetical protein